MAQEYRGEYTLGIDYGTGSCRAAVIDAHNGAEIASAVAEYPRWGQGLFCNPTRNVFRQHPLDYIESLQKAMSALIIELGSRLHLTALPPMAVGSYGAHMGAVGRGVRKGVLVKVISTFTCDMRVGPAPKGEERLVLGMLIKRTVYLRPAFHSKYATLYSRYRNLGSCAEKEFS